MSAAESELEVLIGHLAQIHQNGTAAADELNKHLPQRFMERIVGVDTKVPVEEEVKPHNDWPAPIDQAAFIGLPGGFVDAISPLTEADPAALLLHYLSYSGILLGRTSMAMIGMDEHPARHNALIIGPTGMHGRKGTSETPSRELIKRVDPVMGSRIKSGLVSGEGIVWVIRDPRQQADREDDGANDDVSDDKRLITVETEFASLLGVIKRSGNTTSATIRRAWDGLPLETLAKNKPARCELPHVAVIGHITPDELKALADTVDINNGLLNRFIWCAAQRSKLLSRGHEIPGDTFNKLATDLHNVLVWARQHPGVVTFGGDAQELWDKWYATWLALPRSGLIAAALGRLDVITLRLSVSYALLDKRLVIEPPDLLAARAVAEYHERTVAWVLAERTGSRQADEVISELSLRDSRRMSRTEVRDLFNRNLNKDGLDVVRDLLIGAGKIRVVRVRASSAGGPRQEVWELLAEVG